MIQFLFWLFLALIVYTYAGYPFVWIVASRLRGRRDTVRKEFRPSITVIIPCHNEENVIKAKIENTLSLEYPRELIQIIVASESTDSTDDIVRQYVPRVELKSFSARRGKTTLMHAVVPEARGEILVFTDANVMLDSKSLAFIADRYADPSVGAVAGSLCVTNPDTSPISKGERLYKRYESSLRSSTSAYGRVLSVDGALFSVRRHLYAPISPERGDDFELVIRVLLAGKQSVFEPRALAYEDASVDARPEIARKIRMVSWFLGSALILAREMIRKKRVDLLLQLVSHKLLRWWTPFFFIGIFAVNGMLAGRNSFYAVIFILQMFWYAAGCAGWGLARYFLVYNYGFLAGTVKGLVSKQHSPVWEKTRI